MEVDFADDDLDRLETDPRASAKHGQQIDRAFRKVVQAIRAAADVRDLRAVRGLGFERLQGKRSHQCALRLNKQWRLIVEIVERNGKTRVRVIEIADYH
jgi:proteic killer suppression protein